MYDARNAVFTNTVGFPGLKALAPAIEALGDARFPEIFGETLGSVVPVKLFSVFRLDERQSIQFMFAGGQLGDDTEFAQIASARYAGGYWKIDPMMRSVLAEGAPDTAIRTQTWDAIPPSEYRTFCYERVNVHERVLICRRVASEILMVGLYRTNTERPFKQSDLQRLEASAEVLTTMAWKHTKVLSNRDNRWLHPGEESIAQQLTTTNKQLSTREIEVCTGLLLGRSTKEIARAIGIMPSSIVTFRKRAFLKLNIATRQDLVRLYERSLELTPHSYGVAARRQ
jgi:LuxR family transcriptional regulator, activator of tox operons